MSGDRHVRLFRNGRNQAVRIPVEFELPGDEAIMRRDGDKLVIEPVRKRGLIAVLKSLEPLDETFPDIDDGQLPLEAILNERDVIPLDKPADEEYARIRHDLELNGTSISPNDLLIAAHARSIDATLVTANIREFKRVRNLKIENWMA